MFKFPYRHTGKPRIVGLYDGTIAVALQFTEQVNNRNMKRYRLAYYDISNNPHLIQGLTTQAYRGLEDLLNETITPEHFNNSIKATVKRL
jgi:hypothetical protein